MEMKSGELYQTVIVIEVIHKQHTQTCCFPISKLQELETRFSSDAANKLKPVDRARAVSEAIEKAFPEVFTASKRADPALISVKVILSLFVMLLRAK